MDKMFDSDHRSNGMIKAFQPTLQIRMRTGFQLATDLCLGEKQAPADLFRAAVNLILDWFSQSFQRTITQDARELQDFLLERSGRVSLRGISIPERGIWTARLTCLDSAPADGPMAPGDALELALHRGEVGVRLGVRALSPMGRAVEAATEDPPPVVDWLAGRIGLADGRRVGSRPWMLQTEADLLALKDLLVDPRRSLPVILLTETEPGRLPGRVGRFLLPAEPLANCARMRAHVACLPRELSYTWTDMVGKTWSAFLGAVRTYRPHLDLDADTPYGHPLVMPDHILFWRWNDASGEEAFMSFLLDKLRQDAAQRALNLGGLLFEADARQLRAELNRKRIENEVERYQSSIRTVEELSGQLDRMAGIHAEQLRALRDKVEQLTSDRDAAMALSDEATEAAATLRQANHYLQIQNDALRQMLERRGGNGRAETGAEPPARYDGMAEWAEENLVGRLILHPRAVRALQDAQFEDARLVGRCLNLLAGHYRNMRRGIEGAREAFEQEMAALGLRCSGAISRERAGEQGEDYFVRYPAGSRQRRFIESHLRNNGNTRDPRRCLAIYFFWDDRDQQVVVCSLPWHLAIGIS